MSPISNPLLSIDQGILLVDKPQDWTSQDICSFIKKRYRFKKVGHAGTLDPMATGLLVILINRATKLSNSLMSGDKGYEGVIQLGIATTSQDITGEVTEEQPFDFVTLELVEEKAKAFQGDLMQVPPMVSAIKKDGKRLYKLARQGQEVEREPRPIFIHDFNIVDYEDGKISFSTTVSKGTYVRTLAHDLGKALGTCASLAELRRTHSGKANIEKSVTIDELRELSIEELKDKLVSPGELLDNASHSES